MSKTAIFFGVMLGLCLVPALQAANIIWVSDNKTPAAGVPADQAWVDMLTAAGYTVNLSFRNQEGRALTVAEEAALNAADLIIISRDTNSGDYANNAAEIAQWNALKTPILMQVGQIAGNNRWKWVNGTTANAQPTLQAVLLSHPIFKGVTLGANNQVTVLTTQCSISNTTSAGNGTLIARRADNNQVWIVEWPPGVEFYAGAGQTAGGKRLLFASGGTGNATDGAYNLTDEGKKMFFNAINYLLGTETLLAASEPSPEKEATDVPRDVTLAWKPGLPTQTHNVYLGTEFADVNNATVANPLGTLLSRGQNANTYEPVGLQYGETYYWRIDEVNAPPDATVFKGAVWSFTVEPYGYPIKPVAATAASAQPDMGPEKTINGSGMTGDLHGTEPTTMWLSAGVQPNWIQYEFDNAYNLHELWVWNSNQMIEPFIGFGAKSVKIEHSLDGNVWTELAAATELGQGTGLAAYASNTTVPLGGVVAKYIRLNILSAWGVAPQAGLSEVRFSYVPVQAREPVPPTAGTGVSVDATLNWRPGREAASHAVYFGTDQEAVTNGTVAAKTVTDHSYSPGPLTLDTTYYWRVDEANDAAATKLWPGEVWSFTAQPYVVVEDFESYTDVEGNRIYEAWIDGFGTTTNGSQVGNLQAPFAERTIIHGGKQSMPLVYDNAPAQFSEATLTFASAQNWTAHGIKSLSLYFQGVAGNRGQLYVKINNTKVVYNGAAADLAKSAWIPWNIDLSAVGGNLSNVTRLTIGIEGAGAQGTLYIDDIRLYPKTPEFITPADPGPVNLKALYAFEGNANDTSGNGLNGTLKQAQLVTSGRPNGGSAVKVEKVGYVDLGNPPALDFGTGDWTVTAWFKTAMTGTGDANLGTIYGKGGDNTGGHRYALIVSQVTEGVVTLVVDDDITRYDANARTKINDDQWHFVAGQREGTLLRIYIDGLLEGTTTIPAAYNLAGTKQHNAYVGAVTDNRDGSQYKLFNGLIDDVRLYNKALSQAEILWLAGHTAPVAKPF